VDIFNRAGLYAKVSTEMLDHLTTHAAFVAPQAHLLIKHHCDNYTLARSSDDMGRLSHIKIFSFFGGRNIGNYWQ
jgi:hypothetical protein